MSNNVLYTLWDHQGQTTIEKTDFNPAELNEQDTSAPIWYTASYARESELTPAYLEELLLSPGSMTEKFFEAIMRPGMFSALTLRTAIDQYTDACLSLPGSSYPQLTTTYATLGETVAAVVGCTVNLMRDPHSGALQHANYWSALKRDWEGFIARCREVERSARWPLVLGVDEQNGDVIIVERERMGSLVNEDLPLTLHKHLLSSVPLAPPYALLDILWTLRTKLGYRPMLDLENRLVDIMHQEIAFSFADIVQDQARQSGFADELEEGLGSWIIGRLHSVDDIDRATRTILDVIGGFDMEIKKEEDEVELLLPPSQSQWSLALTATYAAASIQARYELCLALMALLFFLSEELADWDPSLLAEVFAVFRGIAILHFVSRQLAGAFSDSSDARVPPHEPTTTDDVIARLRNMQMSRNKINFTPTYSLIHHLLAQSGDTHGLPGAAHRFLDATGLLQSISPAHATKFEVVFCERLRLLGYYEVTREMLAWLPRTPGVTYVLGHLWLNIGRADDASHLMEKLAGSFGKLHMCLVISSID
jgi:nuclear pore complex protein Nup160